MHAREQEPSSRQSLIEKVEGNHIRRVMLTMENMDRRTVWRIVFSVLLLVVIILQVLTLYRLQTNSGGAAIHTVVLKWDRIMVPARDLASGYVESWKPDSDISITAVQVWMGNPSDALWEGDVYVTLNNQGDFRNADQVIVHYQFDKHANTSAPHQRWFQIGDENAGFKVRSSQTLWVWRAFVNISSKNTTSADGEVMIYYVVD